jgi:hypothetical protein
MEHWMPALATSVDAVLVTTHQQERIMRKKKSIKPSQPKAAKVAPAEKVARNGITQPGEGTACRAIWDTLDSLKAKDSEITFEALRAAVDSKTADATIRTQRQRWKQHHA